MGKGSYGVVAAATKKDKKPEDADIIAIKKI